MLVFCLKWGVEATTGSAARILAEGLEDCGKHGNAQLAALFVYNLSKFLDTKHKLKITIFFKNN